MPTVSYRLAGAAAVSARVQAKIDAIKNDVNAAIQGAGIDAQALAKQACPVDTGRLRASILYHPGNMACTVDTNVNYSRFVEFGTVHMAAQPYLYPAWQRASRQLLDELKALNI